jgi:protein TonB
MRVGIAQRNRIKGWGFSFLLHAILLSAMWPLFRHLPIPTHSEPFQWNVTFVEAPKQATTIEPASDALLATEFFQPVAASERSPAPSLSDLPSPAQQSKNEITETIQTSNEARPAPTVVAQAQPELPPPTPSVTEPTPATPETLPVQRDAAEEPKTMFTATAVETEPSTPLAAPFKQELPSTPASSVADATMAPTQPRDPSPAPLASASPATSGQSSAPRADYRWLQQAVSRRLEELKRSSRPSLEDASRLKVLVKAVVSSAGELMEAEVVKSSGLERIDREAMTLVRRAFPMPLDYAIDRPQIVMRIPITYSRD